MLNALSWFIHLYLNIIFTLIKSTGMPLEPSTNCVQVFTADDLCIKKRSVLEKVCFEKALMAFSNYRAKF